MFYTNQNKLPSKMSPCDYQKAVGGRSPEEGKARAFKFVVLVLSVDSCGDDAKPCIYYEGTRRKLVTRPRDARVFDTRKQAEKHAQKLVEKTQVERLKDTLTVLYQSADKAYNIPVNLSTFPNVQICGATLTTDTRLHTTKKEAISASRKALVDEIEASKKQLQEARQTIKQESGRIRTIKKMLEQ